MALNNTAWSCVVGKCCMEMITNIKLVLRARQVVKGAQEKEAGRGDKKSNIIAHHGGTT